MNQNIRDSLEVLASTCVELCAEGRLWAHYGYAPHIDQVEVYAHLVGHDYCAEQPEPPIFVERIYLSGVLAADPQAQLIALIRKLNAYRKDDDA